MVGPPIPPESRLGKPLEGEYKIQGILGQGELGVSYQAYNPRLKRFFAVLMLDRQLMPTHEMMLAVRADLRRAQALGDCGILPIKQVTDDDGVPGFATELLEGETLRQRLQRGPMPAERALSLIVQVGQALEAAHASGLIHGDLRPESIFLVRPAAKSRYAGRAVLLKHSLRHLRRRPVGFDDSLPIGKLMYRPPEQVAGEVLEADVSGDVFTLGGILHECLTGSPAFGGQDVEEVLDRLARPPDLLKANPATGLTAPLAEALDVVIAGACARDPQARIPTMGELLRALQLVASGADVQLVEQVSEPSPPVQLGRISRILHRLSGAFPVVTPPPARRRDEAPAESGSSRQAAEALRPAPAGARAAELPRASAADPVAARPVAEPAARRPASAESIRPSDLARAASRESARPAAASARPASAESVPPAEPAARPISAESARPASAESVPPAEPAAPAASAASARPASAESARHVLAESARLASAESTRPASAEPTRPASAESGRGASAESARRTAAEAAAPLVTEPTRPGDEPARPGEEAAAPSAASPPVASGRAPSASAVARPAGPEPLPVDLNNEVTLPPDAAVSAAQSAQQAGRRTLIGQPVTAFPQPAPSLLSDTTQPPRPRAAVDLDAQPVGQRPTLALNRLGGEPPTARMSAARLRLTQQTPLGERSTKQLRARDITQLIAAVQAGKLNAAQAVELAREPEEIQLDERDLLPPRLRPPQPPTGPTRVPLTTRPMQAPALGFLLRHQEIVAALLGAATILLLGLLLLRCRG